MTGHDADLHCSGGSQCHYFKTAVDYVRAGAPVPSKPVLVLDRLDLDVKVALDNSFGAGVVPTTIMDPRSAEFASAPINTDLYSAIIVASDETCGGCDLNSGGGTPDSDAINARKAAIGDFFNAGGGVLGLAGANHGDGSDPDDVYYQFLPLPVGGVAVSPPFCLNSLGRSLGLEDQSCPDPAQRTGTNNDINCCATHNSFALPPAGSAIAVAETDSKSQAETLVAEGVISGGTIKAPTTTPPPPKASPSYGLSSSAGTICGRRSISLLRAAVKGKKVKLAGLVGSKLYGKKITIHNNYGARKITVRASATGNFSARVARPGRKDFAKARYRARSGAARSARLKLPQSLTSSSIKAAAGRITIRGKVKKSVLGKRNNVVIRRLVCGRYRTVGSARPDAKGRYKVSFAAASTLDSVAFYRAEAKVLRKPKSKVYVRQFARAIAIRVSSQTG